MSSQARPLHDLLAGSVVQLDGVQLLTTLALPPGELLVTGTVLLRYGLVCLEQPQLGIVPELVVLEYGEQLHGEAAWDFLLHHSNLHPRAEVHGRRDDGVADQLRVSRLDLAQAPHTLVWPASDADQPVPVARPRALIAADLDALPDRPRRYLPCFPSFAAWRDDRG